MTPDDLLYSSHQEPKGRGSTYTKCRNYKDQRGHNYRVSNSCEKLEDTKTYASRKRLRSSASFEKEYDEDWNLFVDDKMNVDCYEAQNNCSIKHEFSIDNFGFQTRIFKENISDKNFTLAANKKISRSSVSITSSDSYDDYDQDAVHKPNLERFPFDKFAYKKSLYNSLNRGLNNMDVPNKHISLKEDVHIAEQSSATFSHVAKDAGFDIDLFLNTNDEILHELQKTSDNYKRILNGTITSTPDAANKSSNILNDIVIEKKEFLSEKLLNVQRLNESETITSHSPTNAYILKVKKDTELLSPENFNNNAKYTPDIKSLPNRSAQQNIHEESISEVNKNLFRKLEDKSDNDDVFYSINQLEKPLVTSLLTNTNEIHKVIIPQIKEETLSIKEEHFDAVLPVCNEGCHASFPDMNILKKEIKEEQPDIHSLENMENSRNWDHAIKTEISDSSHYANINYSWHSAWDELL